MVHSFFFLHSISTQVWGFRTESCVFVVFCWETHGNWAGFVVCFFFFFCFKFTSWFCYVLCCGITKFLCKQLCTGGAQCSANKQKRLEIMENISYPPFSPNAAKSKKLEVQIALIWYQSTVCSGSTRHNINSINKLIKQQESLSLAHWSSLSIFSVCHYFPLFSLKAQRFVWAFKVNF